MANYGLTLVTAPAIEPITLAEARLHVGIAEGVSHHDAKLSALITAAREKVETDTGRAVMTQTWDYSFDLFPYGLEAIHLPKAPVSSVTSLKYYDTSNVQQALSANTYKTFLDREPAEIRLHSQQQWPFLYSEPGVITVRFVCGYGATVSSVPQSLRHAMLLLIGDWFENRTVERATTTTNRAYDSLISRFLLGDEFHAYGRSLEAWV